MSAWLPAAVEQVYKARLRVNGQLVAIKVQRPLCESTISLDLYILRFYAGFLTSLLGMLKRDVDLRQIIDDFGELIYREIDYRAEMVNCQRFAELYASIPDVFVPKVRAVCAHVVEVERLAWASFMEAEVEPFTREVVAFFHFPFFYFFVVGQNFATQSLYSRGPWLNLFSDSTGTQVNIGPWYCSTVLPSV